MLRLPTIIFILSLLRFAVKAEIKGVRLRGGPTPGQGKVEVNRDGRWGAVCGDTWGQDESDVVCKQLEYEGAVKPMLNSHYGAARGPIWLKSVKCTGSELNLSECFFEHINVGIEGYVHIDESVCATTQLAGVMCIEPKNKFADTITLRELPLWYKPKNAKMVEINLDGLELPVCEDAWESKASIVVCRQKMRGFSSFVNVVTRGMVGKNYPEAIMKINCTGEEESIQDCDIETGTNNCKKYGTVSCSDKAPDINLNLTTLEESVKIWYKPESSLVCALEEGCLSKSASKNNPETLKNSKDKRKLLVFSSLVQNFGTSDFRPPLRGDGWKYHKCHKHYHSISNFATQELTRTNGERVESGIKVSFCLRNNNCVDWKKVNKYVCSRDAPADRNQGISVGCADNYNYKTDCQWIDVADVPKGNYLLKIHSNPYKLVPESDYSNNLAICGVEIHSDHATACGCHWPGDFESSDTMEILKSLGCELKP